MVKNKTIVLLMEYENDSDTNNSWSNQKEPGKKRLGLTGNLEKNWDYPDHATAEIG